MPSDSPLHPSPNGNARSDPGLPTVTPPSGGMFFRLFGVPALIVGGLVLVLIVAQPLISKFGKHFLGRTWGSASPEQFLRDLDNSNKEVRWRSGSDLAQILLRDDDLASNSAFALELNHRLRRVLANSAPFEKTYAEHYAKLLPDEEGRELAKLEPDRDYAVLLAQCLSHFMVPVGAPVLEEMALLEKDMEPRALNIRRRQALWALANLGDNVQRFDKLPPEHREAILASLEAAADHEESARAAKSALDYLKLRQDSRPNTLGVDQVVEKCADANDPSLRELAAFVVNFWNGTASENARMEKVLVRLSYDTGKGEDELAKLEEQKPPETGSLLGKFVAREETRSLVKKPGFRVQVNATIALARQGSSKVHLNLLQTLLDEDELQHIFVVQSKNGGAEQPDQAAVVETILNALKAIAELHKKDPQRDLSSLRPNLDKLAHNPNPAVQTEAGRVVLALSNP